MIKDLDFNPYHDHMPLAVQRHLIRRFTFPQNGIIFPGEKNDVSGKESLHFRK